VTGVQVAAHIMAEWRLDGQLGDTNSLLVVTSQHNLSTIALCALKIYMKTRTKTKYFKCRSHGILNINNVTLIVKNSM